MTGHDEAQPAVRRLGEDDWRLWREVRLAALADAPAAFASTVEQEQALDEDVWRDMARSAALFIATAGGAGVGMVAGIRRAAAHERGLGAMWVTPPWRGSGLAGRLAGAVIAWARSDGATAIGLWAPGDSPRARRFYENQGFTATGRSRPFSTDPGRLIIEMRMDLVRGGGPRLTPAGLR